MNTGSAGRKSFTEAQVNVGTFVPHLLILAAMGTCVIVGVLSFLAHDLGTVWAAGAGGVSLVVPFWLLRAKRFRSGNLALMVILIGTITAVTTVGQGLHDTGIVAYPVVLIYIGLTSDRAMLGLGLGLTLVAALWLVVGASLGWFMPAPVTRVPFDYFSFITLTVLVIVAAVAVDLLSSKLRKSLLQARHEIEEREKSEVQRERLSARLAQAEKIESIGRLAGGVAHDFNNMLNVIFGHAEIALEKIGPEHPIHASLEEIRKATVRSADLTRQLLAFARRQTVAPTALNLNDSVQGILAMLRRMIREEIRLNWKPDPGIWHVRMDPSQVDQVLVNLCLNARDAITGVGAICISLENSTLVEASCAEYPGSSPGDYAVLAVSDDGCGMDGETVAQLFEPFFTTKRVGKGTGLGLATVYGVVKQNGGFIDVRSQPGKGATFRIYLPRYAGPVEPRAEAPTEPLRMGHETILIVEDEEAVLKLTRMMLETQGYAVLAASSPCDAIRLASQRAGRIDLLITDVVMPEMNGRQLADKLQTLYPSLKCLYMSGYTADIIADRGVLNPGISFIQKPFSSTGLAEKIRQTLEK